MKKMLLIVCVVALSGCASISEQLENRAVCTVSKDQAFVISMYGPIGIASKLSDKDSPVICPKPQGESQ